VPDLPVPELPVTDLPVIALLDVNVLIALFDPMHSMHTKARAWFAGSGQKIATCPITELGFVRITSNPRYANPFASPNDALVVLRQLHAHHRHVFWPDALSLVDPAFQPHGFDVHKQTTDRYLLRLAVHFGGQLATLDAGIKGKDELEQAALLQL